MGAVLYLAMMVGAFIAALLVIGIAMEAIFGPASMAAEEEARIMGLDPDDEDGL